MPNPRITFSSLPRLRQCQYWARPEVPHSNNENEDARRGTARHGVLEAVLRGQTPEHDSATGWNEEQFVVAVAHIRKGAKSLRGMQAEVAYAWNPHTGESKRLGSGLERNYDATPEGWIPGTGDAASAMASKARELKTGMLSNVDSIRENWQVLALACCIADEDGADIGLLGMHEDGAIFSGPSMCAVVKPPELEEYRKEVVRCLALIPESKPNPGSKCQYCPAIADCPAKDKAVAAAEIAVRKEQALSAVTSSSLEIADNEHARQLLRELAIVTEYQKRLKAAVNDYAVSSGGFPAEGGKYQKVVTTRRKIIVNDEARALLQKLEIPIVVKEEVKVSDVPKAILEKLDDMGAIEKGTYASYKLVKPKKKKGSA